MFEASLHQILRILLKLIFPSLIYLTSRTWIVVFSISLFILFVFIVILFNCRRLPTATDIVYVRYGYCVSCITVFRLMLLNKHAHTQPIPAIRPLATSHVHKHAHSRLCIYIHQKLLFHTLRHKHKSATSNFITPIYMCLCVCVYFDVACSSIALLWFRLPDHLAEFCCDFSL